MSLLIAIEGIDGSGKGTQARLLHESLKQAGLRSMLFSFPRYEQTLFGQAVGEFLNGRFGSLDAAHPFLVSLLYAGDRFESHGDLRRAVSESEVVICDRYVPSNIAHQTAKLDGMEREELRSRIERIEYDIFGLPRADLVLLLDLPVSMAQRLIAQKQRRTYTDKAADLQEADGDYLGRVRQVYLELAQSDPTWRKVDVCREETLRDIGEISDEIRRLVLEHTVADRGPRGYDFARLAQSRREWIDDVLQPWCRRAPRRELLQAELEWPDIAGRVDPHATLWRWAWQRFPDLVHPDLGIDETYAVRVMLRDGTEIRGYPDSRRSRQGQLFVLSLGDSPQLCGPYSIDEIRAVHRV